MAHHTAGHVVRWMVPLLGTVLALVALGDSTTTKSDSTATEKPDSSTATRADTSVAKRPQRGTAALGKKIFAVKCVACHRPDGSGGIKVTVNPTPNWRDPKRMADPRYGDEYLRDCITNGKPKSGMVAWSKQGMKPADIENLIAYIRTFSAAKPK